VLRKNGIKVTFRSNTIIEYLWKHPGYEKGRWHDTPYWTYGTYELLVVLVLVVK